MKKLVSILLAALLVLSCLPLIALADEAPIGTVTVSITDNGDREYLMDMFGFDEDEIEYATPFGVIAEPTEVPVYAGESAAQAVVRLLEMKGITYTALGTADLHGGFYLQTISFTKDGEDVAGFGEYSITPDDDWAKYMSGWMIKFNNWFTSSGISDYEVEDGDIIEVLYTCGMGADIGNDFSNPSAKITSLDISTGDLAPAFSADVKAYTLTVAADVDVVKIGYEMENYGAAVTVSAGDTSYRYLRAIPVENGTVITLKSVFTAYDNTTYEPYTADETEITITVVKPAPEEPTTQEPATEAPAPSDGSKTVLDYITDVWNMFYNFFAQLWSRVSGFFGNLFK